MIGSILKKGIKIARRWFSQHPEDVITASSTKIEFRSGGSHGSRPISKLRHVEVSQSFLGLFGTTINLFFGGDEQVVIKGLDPQESVELKSRLDDYVFKHLVRNAKQKLKKSGEEVKLAYSRLLDFGYMSAWEMGRWQEQHSNLKFLCVLDEQVLSVAKCDDHTFECRLALADPSHWRSSHNDEWVKGELKSESALVLQSGFKLTSTQQEAILRHDNRVLAVAGAGTGKTATVVGKVAYLLKNGICSAEDILILSFSKGAVEELQERVTEACDEPVEVRTFHSLGLNIITTGLGRKPAIFQPSQGHGLAGEVNMILTDQIRDNDSTVPIIDYLVYNFYPNKSPLDFSDEKEKMGFAGKHNLTTLKGEKVNSNQEVQIANWLFVHGIDYLYEAEYRGVQTGSLEYRVYKPDYYLPHYDIYIEHFGVDRDNTPAPYIDKEDYISGMKWKRELHKENGTTLIETYSYQAFEGRLSSVLEEKMIEHSVNLNPLSRRDLLKVKEIQHRLKAVSKLLSTTIALYKEDNKNLLDLEEKMKHHLSGSISVRDGNFLKLFDHVLNAYSEYLRVRGEVDFGDMILEASKLVEQNTYRSPYKVIVVDEFQDISKGRAWLLNALLEQVPDSRLFCVGDDWQSIYRFTGSDISIMTDYRNQWPDAVRIDLDTTFRFNDEINQVSSKFVTSNPNQLSKQIKSLTSKGEMAINITQKSVEEVVRQILQKSPDSSMLVLARYNFNLGKKDFRTTETGGEIRRMTIHKAKGKEADIVVLDIPDAGKYGFPTEISDDPIIDYFLSEVEPFNNAEERRLFYVALTRARDEVWICSNSASSVFVEELISDPSYSGLVSHDFDAELLKHVCPICESRMVKRTNKITGKIFLGCTHYPRCSGTMPGCPKCGECIPTKDEEYYFCPSDGCDWSSSNCPECDQGFVVTIEGKYGDFESCSLYPVTQCTGLLH